MKQHDRTNTGHGHGGSSSDQRDRYDSDPGVDPQTTVDEHDEYNARLERTWKSAAWRTETAQRLRNSGRRPARPDSAF